MNADALSQNPECDQASHVCEAVLSVGGLGTDDHSKVTAVDESGKRNNMTSVLRITITRLETG